MVNALLSNHQSGIKKSPNPVAVEKTLTDSDKFATTRRLMAPGRIVQKQNNSDAPVKSQKIRSLMDVFSPTLL